MAKVTFRRFLTDNEARSSDIIDGQFIVTKDGKSYIDYGTDRVPTNGTLDKQMSDTSLNGVENKVIKKYIDDNINQTKQYSKDYTDNKAKETYSTDEIVVGTWLGKPLYRKVLIINQAFSQGQNSIAHNISNLSRMIRIDALSEGRVAPIFSGSSSLSNVTGLFNYDSTNIKLSVINDSWSAREWYFILEYTKTTDEVPE